MADCTLASTITLNMVQMDCGTRKSVARLLLCSLASKATRVLERGGAGDRDGVRTERRGGEEGSWRLPLDAGLDHVAGHQLQPGLQVFAELLLGPVQVPDEGLQSVQLPEEVLRGARPVAGGWGQSHRAESSTGRETGRTRVGLRIKTRRKEREELRGSHAVQETRADQIQHD